MSAAPQQRPNIDIEEFERRLRSPEAKAGGDPLAELARLVGGQGKSDPLASLFTEHPAPHAGHVRAEPTFDPPSYDRAFEAPPVAHQPPVHPAGLESAPLRDSFDAEPVYVPQASAPAHHAPALDEFSHFERDAAARAGDWAESAPVPEMSAVPAPPMARSKKPLYLTAAVIAAGFIGIGGSLALRGGAPGPGEAPTIKAATGPVKVVGPANQTTDAPGRDSALLDKTATTPPVKNVVSREEAPMDPSQAARAAARVVPTGGMDGAGMASAMPPPPFAAPQPPPRPAQAGGFPEPKKVKTVSVRADGSIISSETTATAPQPSAKSTAAATASQPKNATPKSAARVAATPKIDAGDSGATEPRAAAPRATPKPKTQVARAETQDSAPEPRAASGGGYAVQLAAAGSEAEARQTASRLGQKYSDALGGRRPSFFKATDKDVYRVRVGGLSREAATQACEKVKAAGGGCFVAKN